MKKSFFYSLCACLICFIFMVSTHAYFNSIHRAEAASDTTTSGVKKYSGGRILIVPSKAFTEAKTKCEGGKVCHGTCKNTFVDTSDATCTNGNFTLNVYSPKSASKDYCVPSSARGKGKITSGKIILDAYTPPEETEIGKCICISNPYCAVVTTGMVNANLAHITVYGTSK